MLRDLKKTVAQEKSWPSQLPDQANHPALLCRPHRSYELSNPLLFPGYNWVHERQLTPHAPAGGRALRVGRLAEWVVGEGGSTLQRYVLCCPHLARL